MSFGVMAPTVNEQQNYTVLATVAAGPWINISRWRAGAVRCPSGMTATSFTFNASNTMDLNGGGAGGYQVRDVAGAALTQTVSANKWVPLPPALFNYRFVQLVPNAAPASNLPLVLSGADGPVTWKRIGVPIIATAVNSGIFSTEGASGGSVYLPVGWTGTALTYGIGGGNNDLNIAVDAANASISQTVAADRVVTLPPQVFGAGMLRLTSGTAQAADKMVDVWLKQAG
jgi:hypothetical protein